jgi:hypothetical protein
MSPTNVHSHHVLLSRAGNNGTFSDQATIQPFNKPVLIVSGSFSQDDVNLYSWCLKSPHIGSWLRGDSISSSAASVTSADDRLEFPQVRIGPGLLQNPLASDQTRYILVIQGRSGANRVKVMVTNTVEQAAAVMLHEALNGYSTVFSASYDGPALQNLPVSAKFERSNELSLPQVTRAGGTIVKLVCSPPPKQSPKVSSSLF